MSSLNYESGECRYLEWAKWSSLLINIHIFLAPKANKAWSGGARHCGAEHIYMGDSPLIVSVVAQLDVLCMVRLKAMSVAFTDAFTIGLELLLMLSEQCTINKK